MSLAHAFDEEMQQKHSLDPLQPGKFANSQKSVAASYKSGSATALLIVFEVCHAISEALWKDCVSVQATMWTNIADWFLERV